MSEFIKSALQEIASATSTILISYLSAYFTVKIALKQFYSQKWWEKKADMFTELLSHISVLKVEFRNALAAYLQEQVEFKSSKEDMRNKISKSNESLELILIEGSLIFTEKIRSSIQQILDMVKNYERELFTSGSFSSGASAYLGKINKALEDSIYLIKLEALVSLKLHRKSIKFHNEQ